MTTQQPLSLFVSSRMKELQAERQAIGKLFAASPPLKYFIPWLWEEDAGARPEPIRSTYLKEVEDCDIYIGLFWLGYGPYTIEEFERARQLGKPCLIYQKDIDAGGRDAELTAFLQRINSVNGPDSHTVRKFRNAVTPEAIAQMMVDDVMRLLTTDFREKRKQPTTDMQPTQQLDNITIKAKNRSIATYINNGNINQNNY
jgi:hypothetical protein